MIARQVVATGDEAPAVAARIVDELAGPDLRIAFVYADWRLDPQVFAAAVARGLEAPVVGGQTIGVIGPGSDVDARGAVGLGLYGDWVRVGIGVAQDLERSALTGARDAVCVAADALGTPPTQLDAARHVGITILDGTCGQEEAFCIGSAAVAPQVRMVGGCAATEVASSRRSYIWVNGEPMYDAGAVILVQSELPFVPLSAAHLLPTDAKTVVTAATGRDIQELDGAPAGSRVRELLAELGEPLHEEQPALSFARYIDGMPYVRSVTRIEGEVVHLASAVEPGHVLRIMQPGDLIGTTKHELALARARVGGEIGALLAFSCIGRHWEARARGIERELAEVYAAYRAVGFQSYGEQSGMLLVNHTLTGLAIGAAS